MYIKRVWAALCVCVLLGGSVGAEHALAAEQPTNAAEAQPAQRGERIAEMVRMFEETIKQLREELREGLGPSEERLAALEAALKHEAPATTQAHYGNSNWAQTTRVATCAAGTYVSGISVQYGGTCHRECDPDGGIIRNIVLTCSELPIRPLNDR